MEIKVIKTTDEWKVQFVLNGKVRSAKCGLRQDLRGIYHTCFTFQGVVYSYWDNNDGTIGGLRIVKINPSFYRNPNNVKLVEA